MVARDSIGTLLQEGSLFFISLFRVHLNNTTSCCGRAESREMPPARPGTREFWDRPANSFLLLRGNVRQVRGTTAGSVPTIPRETMFNAILSASPAVYLSHVPSLQAGPLSLSQARHFSNFSFRLLHARTRGFSQAIYLQEIIYSYV